MSELYRDYIDGKADEIINSLGGTITPAPANAELYRDFLDRKFDDVINAVDGVKVKYLEYKGTGTTTAEIVFPVKPKVILAILTGSSTSDENISSIIFFDYSQTCTYRSVSKTAYTQVNEYSCGVSFSDKTMYITGGTVVRAFNHQANTYRVYYI